MEVNKVKRTHGQNVINGWKKSWSVRLSSRAEGALVERFEKHISDHLATIAELTRERDELREVLRSVEWRTEQFRGLATCGECGESQISGHVEDCRLGQLTKAPL